MSDKRKRFNKRVADRDAQRREREAIAPTEWDKLTPAQKAALPKKPTRRN